MPLNPPTAIDRRGLTPLANYDGSRASAWPQGNKPSTPPSAISDLSVVQVFSTRYDLQWTLPDIATGVKIYRRNVTSGGSFVLIATIGPMETYSVSSNSPTTQYESKVVAFNGVGDSDDSNIVSLTTAESTGEPLVSFDFAAGDTLSSPSTNTINFQFNSLSRAINSAPNGEMGLEFAFSGSETGNSWQEAGYTHDGQLFETFEVIRLWIPSNFEHRKLTGLELAEGQDVSSWVEGDIITGTNGTSQGLFHYFDGQSVWLKYAAAYFSSAVWVGVIENTTRSETVETVSRNASTNNNKLSVMWEGDYSSNGSAFEYISNADNLVPEDCIITCKNTAAIDPSSGPGDANNSGTTGNRVSDGNPPPAIDISEDPGNIREFVTRRRRATSPTANDGVSQVWKDGVLVYERLDMPLHSEFNNYFDQGYILGYANSGFDEETTFYVTKYELYDSTVPEGITL